MAKYYPIIATWFRPANPFVMKCCDCDLVHKVSFRLDAEGALEMRAIVDNRETKRLRKVNKIVLWRN